MRNALRHIKHSVERRARSTTLDLLLRRLRDGEFEITTSDHSLKRLSWAWGNTAWSAGPGFIHTALQLTDGTDSPVLECGSGLSTLIIGARLARRDQRLVALEHDMRWYLRIAVLLQRHALRNVTLCYARLRDYGDFAWYDVESIPQELRFGLVLCDGPPGKTSGGRYGLVPMMRPRLTADATILLDDYQRDDERTIAERWAAELPASLQTVAHSPELALIRRRPA